MSRDARVIVVGGGFSGAMTAAHLANRGVETVVIEPGALGRGSAYAATPDPLLLNAPVAAMSARPGAPRDFERWLERQRAALHGSPAAHAWMQANAAPVRIGGDPLSATIASGRPTGAAPVRSGIGASPGSAVGWLAAARRMAPELRAVRPAEPEPAPLSSWFVPRAIYGDYLEATIAELAQGRLATVAARAITVERTAGGYAVRCDDGRELTAVSVVFALGNALARTPSAVTGDEDGYAADPYRALASIGPGDPIALLGTGLTALDVISALRARGHRGRIVGVSRRGLLPTAHGARPHDGEVVPRELVRQPRLPALLRWWRSRIERVHGPLRGDVAAALVAALRPQLSTIWRRLPLSDRAVFLRHLRPRWDVIRHRAPAVVRAAVDTGVADGSIEIFAARLAAVGAIAAGLRCRFVTAQGNAIERDVRWLVNCTGPERDVRRLASPVVRSLLAHRMLAPDPLGLGVLTGPSGQLIGEAGYVPDAFVVGPWRMADLWEASAIPELRQHAADTAVAIAGPPGDGER
jgi:uncharacterized NAD(P)/FAD-binding protein YdhS